MEPKRVLVYCRVSTKDQTPENQLLDLRTFCFARGWQISAELVDVGWSGAKDSRPALRQAMDMIRKRKADILLVHRLDRLFRSLKHLVNVMSELNDLQVALVSFSENIDLTTAQGKLMGAILGSLAEFELSLTKERIYAGLRRARTQGKRLGRPVRPFSVDEARQLREQGITFAEIGKRLNVSRETIRLTLANNRSRNHPIDSVEA